MPAGIQVKSILNKTKRRDAWFLDDYTVNPYSGCSFNCLYCYIRGSKYGEHMEDRTSVKTNAIELLDKQLAARARSGQYGFIVVSSATDPYLHLEKQEMMTRRVLEVIVKYRFPVHIITKSDLVMRDLDLLREIDERSILPADLADKLNRKTLITFSFSTLDDTIGHVFEPGATPPSLRLEILRYCIYEGFHCGVSMMPLLPYISDTSASLELMFSTFKSVGVKYLFPSTITLFGDGIADSKTLVLRAVDKHYPHLLDKYQRLFANGSQLPSYYNAAFGLKMKELFAKYHLSDRIV